MATAPKQTAKQAASAPETPLSATSANVANTLPDYATGAGALKLESAADLQAQIDAMRAFFKAGATQDVNFRLQQLTRLKVGSSCMKPKCSMRSKRTWVNAPTKATCANLASCTTRST